MDPADSDEEAWCAERRVQVSEYLRGQGVDHGEIGEVPAWFVAPIMSIWAIESLKSPGSVGWWVICGDLPTDYCSASDCRHPRLAMKRIAERWREEIAATPPDAPTIGETGLNVELMPLLEGRATVLLEIVDDETAWPE